MFYARRERMETSEQCLYHCGQATQSTRCGQTASGVAAISITFCANTSADAGACSGGQMMRASGGCAIFVMNFSPSVEETE